MDLTKEDDERALEQEEQEDEEGEEDVGASPETTRKREKRDFSSHFSSLDNANKQQEYEILVEGAEEEASERARYSEEEVSMV